MPFEQNQKLLAGYLRRCNLLLSTLDGYESEKQHLKILESRVLDKLSRIMVVGDLNSGKSTLINSILRLKLLPVDQQPTTTTFIEVLDAKLNNSKEQVHVFQNLGDLTYETKQELTMMGSYVRVYSKTFNEDISIIDSPGLNRDVLKTTLLLSKQKEIDVILFVVDAQNHFTLSSMEFLKNAAEEKNFVFIVCSKFDTIKNKPSCVDSIQNQIRELSPETYEQRDSLVHFIDAQTVNDDFLKAEKELHNFLVLKRSISKLSPAKHFMQNILSQVTVDLQARCLNLTEKIKQKSNLIKELNPRIEKLTQSRCEINKNLNLVIYNSSKRMKQIIQHRFLILPDVLRAHARSSVVYPGFLNLFSYLRLLNKSLLNCVREEVKLCQVLVSEEFHQTWKQVSEIEYEWIDNLQYKQRIQQPQLPMLEFNMSYRWSFRSLMNFKFVQTPWKQYSTPVTFSSLAITMGSYLGSAVACGSLYGAKYIIKSLSFKKSIYLCFFGVTAFATVAGIQVVMQLSNSLPEFMSFAIVDHIKKQNIEQNLETMVSKNAVCCLKSSIREFDEVMQKDLQELNDKKQKIQHESKNLQQLWDNYEEINERCELLESQIKQICL